MFTLWPEPVELPEDKTNTPMYKTEVFDNPENAKIAFEQACKENKFPFIYMRPVNQAEFEEQQRQKQTNLNSNFPKPDSALKTDDTPLTNDENTELLKKKTSIPSFTVKKPEPPKMELVEEKGLIGTLTDVIKPRGSFYKDEQKKYSEEISKVYESTGYTLDEVAKKSEEVKDGSFENILKAVSELKDYISNKDDLSKVQTDIILAAQSFKKKNSNEGEKFYRSYSMTNDDVKKMDDWISEHDKKFHKKGYGYQGAIGVSRDEVRMMSTSIGVGIDCVCTECEKLYKNQKEKVDRLFHACSEDVPTRMNKKDLKKEYQKEKKVLDKLYKRAFFEIRGIDD